MPRIKAIRKKVIGIGKNPKIMEVACKLQMCFLGGVSTSNFLCQHKTATVFTFHQQLCSIGMLSTSVC